MQPTINPYAHQQPDDDAAANALYRVHVFLIALAREAERKCLAHGNAPRTDGKTANEGASAAAENHAQGVKHAT